MNTTYDQIWQCFLDNCKTSDINLPSDDEGIYSQIKNASLLFNNRFRDNRITCDNDTETVDRLLNEDDLLILGNYIRLVFLKNELTAYSSTWQPFSKDIGTTHFSAQIKALESQVNEQQRTIDKIIFNTEVDFV
ncbi:hypothetical protein [Bacillus safensis]|uniref:hypothetical protein n=1 Tax=Bacillus safensis TaxID=561879 RepID=UPI00148EADFE|nr:hypothetical protein [Bacillus safensis]NOL36848.1 hypothetical protein [Bacillus safensis]